MYLMLIPFYESFIQHELKHSNVEELLNLEIYFTTSSEKERIILFSRKENLQD